MRIRTCGNIQMLLVYVKGHYGYYVKYFNKHTLKRVYYNFLSK